MEKKFEQYLNKIGEWVVEESKILTYKSLSKNFGVHINTAKQLLHSYWVRQKNDGELAISATYLVAGKYPDGTCSFTIVNENDLENTCSEFVEVTSKHVYSIQTAERVKEIQLLYNKEERSTESIIKCTKSALKSKSNSKQGLPFIKDEKPISFECKTDETKHNKISSGIKVETPSEKKDETKHNKISAGVKVESPTEKNDETASKKPKKDVAPSQNKKNQVEKKGETEKPKEKEKKSKGSIQNFFANSTAKNPPSKTTPEEVANQKSKAPVIETKGKEENKDKSKNKKSNARPEYSDKQKRKRIQVFSDSDNSNSSSEEDVDIEEVEEQPIPTYRTPTPTEEETKVELNCKNKRKKRKIVDVTVMSEDGYLETKKEIVYGTDSEEDNHMESEPAKNNFSDQTKLKVEERKKESNVAKKQSSLFAFFKKN